MIERRAKLLRLAFGLLAVVLIFRLVALQTWLAGEVLERAWRAPDRELTLPAPRGALLDREGRPLAQDVGALRIEAFPSRWRERSLPHALHDLSVLLDLRSTSGAAQSDAAALAIASDPGPLTQELLALPAESLQGDRALIVDRAQLLVRPVGRLQRLASEGWARYRTALGVLLDERVSVGPRRLAELAAREGTVGEALGLTEAGVVRRIEREGDWLLAVAKTLGDQDLAAAWERMTGTLEAESAWILDALERERRESIERLAFGDSPLSVEVMGAAVYAGVARQVAPDFGRFGASLARAGRARGIAESLLAGRLPPGGSEAADLDEPLRLERLAADRDWLIAADIPDRHPDRVREAYAQRSEREEGESLPPRRLRELLGRYRGGRAFLVGLSRREGIAARIWGAGRLQDLGFAARPTFARDPDLEDGRPSDLGLLVGSVAPATRRGVYGLEARLDAELRGRDGSAVLAADGHRIVTSEPKPGQDLRVTLSEPLCRRLSDILAQAAHHTPAAIAMLDARTGAILGMASWPHAESAESAYAGRRELEAEARSLRAVRSLAKRRDTGALAQRRARLAQTPDPEARRELRWVELAIEHGPQALDAELNELAVRRALHPGWQRAFDAPGYSGPGSVFKVATVVAALEHLPDFGPSTEVSCVGTMGRPWHSCKDHGRVDAARALEISCNEYCYLTGHRLGSPRLVETWRELGFLGAVDGLLPALPAWEVAQLQRSNAKSISIGGQNLRCTPVRAAGMMASVAAGRTIHPYLWRAEDAAPPPAPPLALSARSLAAVRAGLVRVCGARGTAKAYAHVGLERLRVAAKTGTADYRIFGGDDVNEAWLAGYAPYEDPRFAFAVVISRTDLHGAATSPMAIRALDAARELLGVSW